MIGHSWGRYLHDANIVYRESIDLDKLEINFVGEANEIVNQKIIDRKEKFE